MSLPREAAQTLARAGIEHLRRGDAAAAREAFGRAASADGADATIQLGLAYACQTLGDTAAARVAVDKALAREPRNLRALMLKAEQLQAAGDRAAASHFQAVLQCAPPLEQLPPELRELVARAAACRDRFKDRLEAVLREQSEREAAASGPASRRFAQSLDLLSGRKELYAQAPRMYHFPELPQVQFFERADFPWLDAIEAAADTMREELQGIVADPRAFTPYVQGDLSRPTLNHGGLLNSPDWSAFYLWKDGEPVAANAARCPRTVAALSSAPFVRIPGRSPNVLFSQLRPRSRIPPHNGFVNTRLIVHLPLTVPPGCALRVGNDVREWQPGKAWLFDDTIEHEAWNDSDRTRVILLFEVWRPELTASERAQVSAMFQAIDRERGRSADWGI